MRKSRRGSASEHGRDTHRSRHFPPRLLRPPIPIEIYGKSVTRKVPVTAIVAGGTALRGEQSSPG